MYENSHNKYYYLIIFMIFSIIILGLCAYALFFYYNKYFDQNMSNASSNVPSKSNSASSDDASTKNSISCTPSVLTSEETALFENSQNISNNTYHFTYKVIKEWGAALSNNDKIGSFAEFPWGDESLAAVNLIVVSGSEGVKEFPIGDLVEATHKTVKVDCIDAIYTIYKNDKNDRTDKEYGHIRTTFTKNNIPYIIILNYPLQGASADGDEIDAYNITLKTIKFD